MAVYKYICTYITFFKGRHSLPYSDRPPRPLLTRQSERRTPQDALDDGPSNCKIIVSPSSRNPEKNTSMLMACLVAPFRSPFLIKTKKLAHDSTFYSSWHFRSSGVWSLPKTINWLPSWGNPRCLTAHSTLSTFVEPSQRYPIQTKLRTGRTSLASCHSTRAAKRCYSR